MIVAIAIGFLAATVLVLAGVGDWSVALAVPFLSLLVVSIADRDGWKRRTAIAEIAVRQRQRWTSGSIPLEPSSAESWLAVHGDAPILERAAMLQAAGRPAEALELIQTAEAATPEDAVRIARMRTILRASAENRPLDDRELDAVLSMPEFGSLTEDERRFNRLALAWAQAWLSIQAGRPWQRGFTNRIRGLEPYHAPFPLLVLHASQQFAAPLACAVVWLGYVLIASLTG